MIAAHGARITVTNEEVILTPTALSASLAGNSADTRLALSEITGTAQVPGDAWTPGALRIDTNAGARTVLFAPGDAEGPGELAALLAAAMSGDAPDAEALGGAGIPGFSFVALDVETANQNWGSICQIGVVKVIDGEEVDRASWLCRPPAGLDEFDPFNVGIHGITAEAVAGSPQFKELIEGLCEFVGELPLVAHNAQFDSSALRYACLACERPVPQFMFACTLAQARATKLDVANHRLPTLAEFFQVELTSHHNAAADAAACAGIMVGLARRAGHEGSLMSFVHDSGFALGSIDADRVTPVLRDRSGATRALQAERVAAAGEVNAAVEAVVSPQGSNQEGPAGGARRAQRRGGGASERATDNGGRSAGEQGGRSAAPWQAVATPETVPEPNEDADPESPLYGENVTLTGDFQPHDKGELWSRITELGAQVGKNVTKKTTIVVAGQWATMTSKEKRARELQEKGQDIQIWDAARLYEVLGL